LSDTADAGALAQDSCGYVGIADRIETQILDASYAPGQQNKEDDQPNRRIGSQQPAAGGYRGGEKGIAHEQPAKPEKPQKRTGQCPHQHRAEAG